MIGEGRELKNMKGRIKGEKSVKEKKVGAKNNEEGLDKWCRKRAEAERENGKVEAPKKIKDKEEQEEENRKDVEELKVI